MPKEFVVAFILVFSLLWFYLLTTRLVPAWAFATLIGLTLAGGVILYRVEDVKEVSLDPKGGLLAKMEDIKKDVYVKAESVRRMGEDIAVSMAYVLRGVGRFADEDQESKLGQQREHLVEMLRKLGIEEQRIAEVLQPLTETIRDDLAGNIVGLAVNVLSEQFGPRTTKDQSDTFIQQAKVVNEVRSRLIDAPQDQAATAARAFLGPKGLWTPAVEAAVQRFEEFRRTGHVTPNPSPAAS